MQVEVNGQIYHVPSDIGQIKLGQFIEWYNEYGRKLDEQMTAIASTHYDDEFLREDAIDQQLDKEALAWYSFFTGCDFEAIADTYLGAQVCDQYRVIRYLIHNSENDSRELTGPVDWNGEQWEIQNYKVDPASEMTFNEIITSKEVIRQLHKIGKGKWEPLLYLCAIFFRKVGEPFDKKFMFPGSERVKLMNDLPLSYAMAVSFFLTDCVGIWKSTLASSNQVQEATQNPS